jgi:hypothetical protein
MAVFFGNSDHTGGNGAVSHDVVFTNIYTAPASGPIDLARAWIGGGGNSTTTVYFIVYSVVGGVPSTLLGHSDPVSVPAGQAVGQVSFTFSTLVPVTLGFNYAIGLNVVSSQLTFGFGASGVTDYEVGGIWPVSYSGFSTGSTRWTVEAGIEAAAAVQQQQDPRSLARVFA